MTDIDHRDIAAEVSRLSPGQRITISRNVLAAIGSSQLLGILGPTWSAVDRILENIVGSSYEFVAREDVMTGDVTFERLQRPLEVSDPRLTYVAPDRRDRFRREGEYYIRNT